MAASKSRRERRLALQQPDTTLAVAGGGGYGQGNVVSKPATGFSPNVSPFILPKQTGLNVISKSFPNNYFVEWDINSWRASCDQAIKMGYPISYAALVSWAFESSPFIQSLFNALGYGISKVPIYMVDSKGNRLDQWTKEICGAKWFIELRKEILFSHFWGFTGINFDPVNNKTYKYPMQQIDPINRMLRENTYNFTDGMDFFSTPNLLFVQPSTNYESFLGWMQPITRMFIMQNMNSMNWIQAGKRLAFPLLQISYPGVDNSNDYQNNTNNEYRNEAEQYAANIDPSKTLLSPYIVNMEGKIEEALKIQSHDSTAKAGMHKVFQEFNADAQNEIHQMILGGSLTATTGKNGSKGVGDVHADKLEVVLNALNDEILSVLNDESDFKRKIQYFYKNFPKDFCFDINRTKEFKIEELEKISDSVTKNGLQLTPKFFVKFGLDNEDLQVAPNPLPKMNNEDSEDTDLHVSIASQKSVLGLKKKVLMFLDDE